MRRTKASRVVTFVMAASLLIGSIHVVGAKEQSKEYDAPELTLLRGASDYDLTEGITYDSEKYTLSVTDTGNFDISVPGDYEVSYALTEKENPVENTESTEGTEAIESTENVSETETTEPEETQENTGDTGKTEGDGLSDGTADAQQPDQKNEADSVDADSTKDAQNTQAGAEAESSAEPDVTIEDADTPKADASDIEGSGTKQKTIHFQRTVHVVAAEDADLENEISTFSVNGNARAAINSDKINLGNAVWTDDSRSKFTFPYARITTTTTSLLALSIIDGEITTLPNDNEIRVKQINDKKSNAIVLWKDNVSNDYIEKWLRTIEFTKTGNDCQVRITIDGNESEIPQNVLNKMKYFSWINTKYIQVDGLYAMYVEAHQDNWLDAYKEAQTIKIAGMQGYLATPNNLVNADRMGFSIFELIQPDWYAATPWIGVTRLLDGDKLVSSDTDEANLKLQNKGYGINKKAGDYYYADGPFKGQEADAGTFGIWAVDAKDDYTSVRPWDLKYPFWEYPREYNNASCAIAVYASAKVDPDSYKWIDRRYTNGIAVDIPYKNPRVVEASEYAQNQPTENGKTYYDVASEKTGGSTNGTPVATGYMVFFGGYDEGQDPGGRDESLCESASVTVNNVYDAEVKIIDKNSNEVKYGPLADALDEAEAYETVEIIKDSVTPATDATLKKDVMLKSFGRNFVYTGDADASTIDVAADGSVTMTDGHIKVSDNASLKVKSPADGNTYQITTPAGAAHVVVPTGTGDETPYLYNENTTGTSILTVGDVKYTFSNKSLDHLTLVYIPDAMYQNEMVTKAEISADKTATIKIDDGDRNVVEIKGGGAASDTVTVERRSSDRQKADVSLPANVTANVFGHEIGAVPAGGVKVSHAFAGNVKYPNRDYITIKNVGESITVDGVTYTAGDADTKFYLGTFNVSITTGTDAEINGGKPADPHYLESYTVKISPKAGYDLDKDSFTVTMKKSDRAADGETTYSVAKNNFNDVCTEEADGSITVKLDGDRVVTGDITINAAAKRQMTTLKVTGLTDNGAKGTYTAENQNGNTYKPNDDGEITVNRNEELTITFTPDDFKNPYYSDLTGEQGESFSILTGLTETSNGNADLFDQTMKDSFDWTGKSYKLTYTPTQANVEFAAAFTPSHIVHIHVTGGTAEVTDNTLLKKETAAGAQQFQHVIVADNGTVPVTLNDTTGHNPVVKTAYWSDVTATPDHAGTDVTNNLTGAGPAYTYTTPAVTKPQALNVTFEEGQTVDVTVTHGTLDQAGRTWTDKGNNTYQTIVKNNGTLEVKVKPDTGYGLKSITVNGTPIDIEQAVKDSLLVYDADKGIYTHTSQNIYQAWKVEVDFEKQHEIIFKDQNNATINKTEHITVVDGGTIPKATFAKMQKETDKLKADNETFFVWVDKNDNDKVYNENTVIDANTADQVTLTPVYRTNVTPPAADGSTIAADDFIIHVDDLRNLTADQAKTYANVKAYDKDSNDITA